MLQTLQPSPVQVRDIRPPLPPKTNPPVPPPRKHKVRNFYYKLFKRAVRIDVFQLNDY